MMFSVDQIQLAEAIASAFLFLGENFYFLSKN